jgi:hypothetical protein
MMRTISLASVNRAVYFISLNLEGLLSISQSIRNIVASAQMFLVKEEMSNLEYLSSMTADV